MLKHVKDFPNYLVSDTGRVYNNAKDCRPLSLETLKDGYPCVSLYHEGRKKFAYVHKLVAEAFLPCPEEGEVVMHLNDVKTDNRAVNLRWGSREENTSHMKVPFWRRNALS